MKKAAFILFLLLGAAVGLTLYYSAQIGEQLLTNQLRTAGFDQVKIKLSRPGLSSVSFSNLSAVKQTESYQLRAGITDMRVGYSWRRFLSDPSNAVNSIDIKSARVTYSEQPASNDPKSDTSDIAIPELPFSRLTIGRLTLNALGRTAFAENISLNQRRSEEIRIQGKFEYSGADNDSSKIGPFVGSAVVNTKPGAVTATLDGRFKEVPVSGEATYQFENSYAEFKAESNNAKLAELMLLFSAVQPEELKSLKIGSGTANAAVNGRFQNAKLSGAASLKINKAALSLNDLRAENTSLSAEIAFNDKSFWSATPAALSIGMLDVFSHQVSDVKVKASLRKQKTASNKNPRVIEAKLDNANLLGGRIYSEQLVFQPGSKSSVVVIGDGLRIEKLLELYPNEVVQASGTIDARLPVGWDGSKIRIEDGSLKARPPGGSIHYLQTSGASASNPSLQLAFKALRNYQYTALSSKVNYLPSGNLELALSLQGFSPEISREQPINLNLTISENIPALIDSLRIGSELERKLGGSYSEKK